MNLHKNLVPISWLTTAIVSVLAIIAWGDGLGWKLAHLSIYQIFPLLGLVAFSIMWSHYLASLLRRYTKAESSQLRRYYASTGYVVLVLILLHPGLLIYQLFRDGAGLPPSSYYNYVAPGLGWVTLLGSASLLAFLAFELNRFYGERPWWRYFTYASDVAMLAIVYHGLRLGGNLQGGWYQKVWYFYAVALIGMLGYTYATKARAKAE